MTKVVRLLLPGSSHLNETYTKVLTGKYFADAIPVYNGLNQRDALTH
jgi:hypothetical protein